MKIILVNYRYFISGGPERYYFNIKEILERNGHVVIPFSVKNSRNFSSDYETYFLDRLDDEVYFAHSNKKSMKVILKSFSRMFYSFEAKRKFRQLLTDTNPDLVYIMQYHNKISPSIIDAAKNLGIGCVMKDFAKEKLEQGEIFTLQFREELPMRDMCLVTDRRSPLSPAARRLLDMIMAGQSEP